MSRSQRKKEASSELLSTRPAIWTWLYRSLITAIVGLIGVSLYWGTVEWKAAKTLASSIAEINSVAASSQVSNSQKTFSSEERAQAEAAWGKVCNLSRNSVEIVASHPLPFVGSQQRRHFFPGSVWNEEPVVAEMLEHCRPIFESFEEAILHPVPRFSSYPHTYWWVWYPSDGNGLQHFYRIVQLEINHAIYHKDHPRAIRGLQMLARLTEQQTIQADPNFYMSSRMALNYCMRESLGCTEWNVDELNEIQQLVAAKMDVQKETATMARARRQDLSQQLKKVQDGNADSLLGLTSNEIPILKLPSWRLSLLEDMNNFVKRCESGEALQNYFERFQPGKIRYEDNSALNITGLNGLETQVVGAVVTDEDLRRLTQTAIAIKKYQLEKGEWPAKLSDLQPNGLQAEELMSMAGHPLGFEVSEMKQGDVPLDSNGESSVESNGDSKEAGRKYAWLWLLPDDFSNKADIDQAARPGFQPEKTDSDSFRLVLIR